RRISLVALLIALFTWVTLIGCGSSSHSQPPGNQPSPTPGGGGGQQGSTTTVAAETSNNTSAANSFPGQPNGNLPATNVSKLPINTLLYSGSNTKIYAHWMAWFGGTSHMDVGYASNDDAQVRRQVEDMMSRGISGAIAAWYGATAEEESRTQLVKKEAEAQQGFASGVADDDGAVLSAAGQDG